MEKIYKITRETVIPLGLMATLLAGVFYGGQLAKQVQITTDISMHNSESIQSLPSRQEFNDLKGDIKEIKGDVKSLIKQS